MTQTLAIFVDAYRYLNARKLFWFTLILSGMVVVACALPGVNERGMTFAGWQILESSPTMPLNSETLPPGEFYKILFVSFGLTYWLTWAATILGLISTAGIFPDLASAGAIDVIVSKPLSRLRLFLTQYAAGMLFVTLQVVVFITAAFLVIGIRGGEWEPGLFIAVPIVVVFFSYLYSVCVLCGVWTRSAIAAVLMTLIFWMGIYAIHLAEEMVSGFLIAQRHGRAFFEPPRVDTEPSPLPGEMEAMDAREDPPHVPKAAGPPSEPPRWLDQTHSALFAVSSFLPKTSATIQLLERWLIDLARLGEQNPQMSEQMALAEEINKAKSPQWILGTSLAFEAVVVALAAWIFCRRDY